MEKNFFCHQYLPIKLTLDIVVFFFGIKLFCFYKIIVHGVRSELHTLKLWQCIFREKKSHKIGSAEV